MDITLESLITRIILHASLIRKNKEYDHSRVACAFEEIAAALNMVNQFRDAAKMVPDHTEQHLEMLIDRNLDMLDPCRKGRMHPDNEREYIWETIKLLRDEIEALKKNQK